MKFTNSTTMRAFSLLTFFLFYSLGISSYAQENISIDKVIAVVGNERILLSDIEQELLRIKMQGSANTNINRCELLEQFLIQKLLITQAKIDSIEVNEGSIEAEVDRRLKYFINQIGSEKALENYFNKPIFEIKDDLREIIREQQLTQQMQRNIIDKVNITPSDVKAFYKKIPTDSLPELPMQYELQQIVIYPPDTEKAKLEAKEKLLEIRNRVLNGERFATLAALYSEDRASAIKGGELGFRSREELVKAFADAAFNLKEGQISQVVETEYGLHIIQLIEKRNDQVNVRHILLKPQFTSDLLSKAVQKLDSIANLIRTDSISFDNAVLRFSEDKKSNLNKGLMLNPFTNTSLFEKEQLQPSDFYAIKDLKEGEFSSPFESRDEHANIVFKIIRVKRIIPAHKANLKDDYDIIQQLAKSNKENEILGDWVSKKIKSFYIRIDEEFHSCNFHSQGWIK
ncbi:MAG TPA: peptidylprolyl isomerase [Bacteroidales bacterium]|nr:peptidylprolyl isomerase [Bacteroidales bacterium]